MEEQVQTGLSDEVRDEKHPPAPFFPVAEQVEHETLYGEREQYPHGYEQRRAKGLFALCDGAARHVEGVQGSVSPLCGREGDRELGIAVFYGKLVLPAAAIRIPAVKVPIMAFPALLLFFEERRAQCPVRRRVWKAQGRREGWIR